jgi:hypothetical protein
MCSTIKLGARFRQSLIGMFFENNMYIHSPEGESRSLPPGALLDGVMVALRTRLYHPPSSGATTHKFVAVAGGTVPVYGERLPFGCNTDLSNSS